MLDLTTKWRWVISFTPWPLYHRGNNLGYTLDRKFYPPSMWYENRISCLCSRCTKPGKICRSCNVPHFMFQIHKSSVMMIKIRKQPFRLNFSAFWTDAFRVIILVYTKTLRFKVETSILIYGAINIFYCNHQAGHDFDLQLEIRLCCLRFLVIFLRPCSSNEPMATNGILGGTGC
jgi:hypothetical protein